MALFRIDPQNPFQGPHQGQPINERAPAGRAKAGIILIHGRSAAAQSMLMLADEFKREDIHYLAPQAHKHTWYPYSFLAETEKNEPGLSSGLQLIHDLTQKLVGEGLAKEKIILLGFSQGACLILEFAARHPQKLGGVAGLSGGLIGADVDENNYEGSLEGTPIFLGCSDSDPHIPVERVHQTAEILEQLGGEVEKKIYPDMPHTVNEDEIEQVKELLDTI